ncbi:MAG: hypothetical protein HY402_05915 [Elusimicrobia bacterium]|nr:hypothetical protein [Elusimicrobiota bacterium]
MGAGQTPASSQESSPALALVSNYQLRIRSAATKDPDDVRLFVYRDLQNQKVIRWKLQIVPEGKYVPALGGVPEHPPKEYIFRPGDLEGLNCRLSRPDSGSAGGFYAPPCGELGQRAAGGFYGLRLEAEGLQEMERDPDLQLAHRTAFYPFAWEQAKEICPQDPAQCNGLLILYNLFRFPHLYAVRAGTTNNYYLIAVHLSYNPEESYLEISEIQRASEGFSIELPTPGLPSSKILEQSVRFGFGDLSAMGYELRPTGLYSEENFPVRKFCPFNHPSHCGIFPLLQRHLERKKEPPAGTPAPSHNLTSPTLRAFQEYLGN